MTKGEEKGQILYEYRTRVLSIISLAINHLRHHYRPTLLVQVWCQLTLPHLRPPSSWPRIFFKILSSQSKTSLEEFFLVCCWAKSVCSLSQIILQKTMTCNFDSAPFKFFHQKTHFWITKRLDVFFSSKNEQIITPCKFVITLMVLQIRNPFDYEVSSAWNKLLKHCIAYIRCVLFHKFWNNSSTLSLYYLLNVEGFELVKSRIIQL